MPNADSHCQGIQVHCTVLGLEEFFSRGSIGNIQQVMVIYIHTHWVISLSPETDCHLSLGSPFGHRSCTWIWDGEKCEISVTLSFVHLLRRRHTAQDKRRTADIYRVFFTQTPAPKKLFVTSPCAMSWHSSEQGQNLTQHIHINRYSPKSLKLFSETSRRNISLCSYTQAEGSFAVSLLKGWLPHYYKMYREKATQIAEDRRKQLCCPHW